MASSKRGTSSSTKYKLRSTPERVTITRLHHPLREQAFEVLKGGSECITVRGPDGRPMRVARAWTDVDGAQPEMGARMATFTVASLRSLIALVEALSSR